MPEPPVAAPDHAETLERILEALDGIAVMLGLRQAQLGREALAALLAERQQDKQRIEEFVVAADWYRRCLEDVIDRKPVRGLAEARAAYDSTLARIRAVLAGEGDATPEITNPPTHALTQRTATQAELEEQGRAAGEGDATHG